MTYYFHSEHIYIFQIFKTKDHILHSVKFPADNSFGVFPVVYFYTEKLIYGGFFFKNFVSVIPDTFKIDL